jgi:succinate dehydrogenase/fumarate reductase flavoprotein subunit
MTPAAGVRRVQTDILILGSGGAGLFAALHAHQRAPGLKITVAVKGLLGKCGCTRMVQGGYNVALAPGDSVERHFMDTIDGSKWLADQDLAWTLVSTAVERVRELENELGCFFDRNPDGSIHQKAFAGQTFDRTVHKGDLTGIEIINRLAEQVWARGIDRLEEHRAIELVKTPGGDALAGVLMIDMRSGGYVFVQARAVLLATGGGPTMYKYHTPSGDKSCDGLAMALRAGLPLRDMEMVQFHPTGLLAGSGTRMTGTVLEEGLRGAGGWQPLHLPRDARRPHHAQRRRVDPDAPPGRRRGAAPVQGHGRALRRLRLRPGRRPRRGGAHRALHDGRRGLRAGHEHPAAGAVRGRRGHRRRARRQPPGRQRGGQFHRLRRHCRRHHGRLGVA